MAAPIPLVSPTAPAYYEEPGSDDENEAQQEARCFKNWGFNATKYLAEQSRLADLRFRQEQDEKLLTDFKENVSLLLESVSKFGRNNWKNQCSGLTGLLVSRTVGRSLHSLLAKYREDPSSESLLAIVAKLDSLTTLDFTRPRR